jgi:chemotaxis protein histidine kinase CheA
MNNSGDAAEQIVRMSLEGVDVAARITGAAAKEIAILIIAALKNNEKNLKLKGKARLTTMLKSGKPLEIFSLRERDLAKFAQSAKQYGIVYCVLRNKKGSPDGLCDIMVRADDAPKISRVIERFKFATVDKAKIESEIIAEKAAKTVAEAPEAMPETPAAEPQTADAGLEAADVAETEALLDELMGTKEGKAEPDKPEPEKTKPEKIKPEKTKPVKTKPEKTEPVKTVPIKAEPDKAGKEAADSHPFAQDSPQAPLPSAPTSDSKKKPVRTTSDKPSVRELIREIAAARKKEEAPKGKGQPAADKPKEAPAATTHKQPPPGGKAKSKKTKGSR